MDAKITTINNFKGKVFKKYLEICKEQEIEEIEMVTVPQLDTVIDAVVNVLNL